MDLKYHVPQPSDSFKYTKIKYLSVKKIRNREKSFNFTKLKDFLLKYNRRPVLNNYDYNENKLSIWSTIQMRLCVNKPEHKNSLEWKKFIEEEDFYNFFPCKKKNWYKRLNELEIYIKKYNSTPTLSTNKVLSDWLFLQNNNYKNKKNVMKNLKVKKSWEEFKEKYIEIFYNREEIWFDNFDKFKKIIEKKTLPYNERIPYDKKTSNWVKRQKTNFKNKLRIMKNEIIYNIWDDFIKKNDGIFKITNTKIFKNRMREVNDFIRTNVCFPKKNSNDYNEILLESWLREQHYHFKINKYLTQIPFINITWINFMKKNISICPKTLEPEIYKNIII